MNVLFVSHSAGSPHHGPNLRTYYVAKGLVDLGCTVQVVTSSFFHKFRHQEEFDGPFLTRSLDGIDYTWIKTRPYRERGIGQVLNQLDFVRNCYLHGTAAIRRIPDVIIGSSPHPLIAFYCRWFAQRHRIPFLFEVRDLWPLVIRDLGGFSRWHPYVLLLALAERHAVRHARAIVSVKPGDIDYFRTHYGFPAERFHYLPNGYLPPVRETPPLAGEVAGKLPAGKFIIGYVGALSYYYEIDLLLDAAAIIRDRDHEVAFVLAGAGVLGVQLARRIKEEALDNVVLLGYLENRQIMPLLQRIDLCYLGLKDAAANRYGISCNKLYEYLSAGKPVVACYRTLHDPVRAARCGETVETRDAARLAECILRLKDSGSAALRQLGDNARRYFHDHHDMNVIASHYHRLLCSVTAAGDPERPAQP